MAKTSTFAVTDSATAIVTTVATTSVTIAEDPTASGFGRNFQILAPKNNSTAITRLGGTSWTFTAPGGFWRPGVTVGYVKLPTAADSTTFQKYEPGY